jgi:hypothetical protein
MKPFGRKRPMGRRTFLGLAGTALLAAGTWRLWPKRPHRRGPPQIPLRPWNRDDLYSPHDLAG